MVEEMGIPRGRRPKSTKSSSMRGGVSPVATKEMEHLAPWSGERIPRAEGESQGDALAGVLSQLVTERDAPSPWRFSLVIDGAGRTPVATAIAARAGPCGTTLVTAFGSDLRSVDTLRGSRFALSRPDDFVAGASRSGDTHLLGERVCRDGARSVQIARFFDII